MVTQARREREKQQVRQGILDAARKIASCEGWSAVTVRKIAEQIEYSPPTIYEYFANKDAILRELLCEGFATLLAALTAARETTNDPYEALHRVARAYCDFAWHSPDLYQVMYGLDGATFRAADTREEGMSIGATVAVVVSKIVSNKGKHANDVEERVNVLWATVHGLIALAMAGRIGGGQANVGHLVERSVDDALLAWKERDQ